MASWLPHIDAALNFAAFVLLIAGWLHIRRGNRTAHKTCMLAAFGVSVVFLIAYVTHHALSGSRIFPKDAPSVVRGAYLAMLASHVILAAVVPFLASATIWFGFRDDRVRHKRLARWTWPIWIYVSVTGILVYLMLYHVYA